MPQRGCVWSHDGGYSGTVDIDSESRLFAIEAVGPWTITIR